MNVLQIVFEALLIGSPAILGVTAVILYNRRFGNWRRGGAGRAFMLFLIALGTIFTVNLIFNLFPLFGIHLETVAAVWAEIGTWLLTTAAYITLIVSMARTPSDRKKREPPAKTES